MRYLTNIIENNIEIEVKGKVGTKMWYQGRHNIWDKVWGEVWGQIGYKMHIHVKELTDEIFENGNRSKSSR